MISFPIKTSSIGSIWFFGNSFKISFSSNSKLSIVSKSQNRKYPSSPHVIISESTRRMALIFPTCKYLSAFPNNWNFNLLSSQSNKLPVFVEASIFPLGNWLNVKISQLSKNEKSPTSN